MHSSIVVKNVSAEWKCSFAFNRFFFFFFFTLKSVSSLSLNNKLMFFHTWTFMVIRDRLWFLYPCWTMKYVLRYLNSVYTWSCQWWEFCWGPSHGKPGPPCGWCAGLSWAGRCMPRWGIQGADPRAAVVEGVHVVLHMRKRFYCAKGCEVLHYLWTKPQTTSSVALSSWQAVS